jgi:ComF family protein
VEAIVPACRYAGVVRELLHRFKYGRDECLAVPLGDLLGRAFGDGRLRAPSFRALVPVPLHPRRQRERGFNQAELLAGRVRGACGLSVRKLLRRIRPTSPQAGFDREERIKNLQGAFVAAGLEEPGGDYLLVDDVSTTGATLDACASALRSAGAGRVFAMVVARG